MAAATPMPIAPARQSRRAMPSHASPASAGMNDHHSTGVPSNSTSLVAAEPGVELDYLARVDSTTFTDDPDGDLLVVAARIGTTRLIDNLVLTDTTTTADRER